MFKFAGASALLIAVVFLADQLLSGGSSSSSKSTSSGNQGSLHAVPQAARSASATARQRSTQQRSPSPSGESSGAATGASSGSIGGVDASPAEPELFTYRVVKEFPHDSGAFTQGLQFDRLCPQGEGVGSGGCRDVFWESTGLNGQSSVREVELDSGTVLRQTPLPRQDFGEGLTRLGDRLYQLTWQSPRTWSYAVSDFSQPRLLQTPLKDGWGITTDGTHLIVGDSTDTLFFLDPDSMQIMRSVRVADGGRAVHWVNELEWVRGQVMANVWMTECLARIDPGTGAVTGWVSLKGLRKSMLANEQQGQRRRQADVLNGIAWDEEGERLFVTGKLWSKVYQIELVPLDAAAGGQATLQRVRSECIVNRQHLG